MSAVAIAQASGSFIARCPSCSPCSSLWCSYRRRGPRHQNGRSIRRCPRACAAAPPPRWSLRCYPRDSCRRSTPTCARSSACGARSATVIHQPVPFDQLHRRRLMLGAAELHDARGPQLDRDLRLALSAAHVIRDAHAPDDVGAQYAPVARANWARQVGLSLGRLRSRHRTIRPSPGATCEHRRWASTRQTWIARAT